jgi:hypothetical protein
MLRGFSWEVWVLGAGERGEGLTLDVESAIPGLTVLFVVFGVSDVLEVFNFVMGVAVPCAFDTYGLWSVYCWYCGCS